MKNQKLNHRQVRWALYLSRFNFILKHVLGKSMRRENRLNRRPDWKVGVEKNNKDQKLLKPKWFEVRSIEKKEVLIEGVDVLEKI